MQRTHPLVREKCRDLYGSKWWDVEQSKKRERQDEAIGLLQSEGKLGKEHKKTSPSLSEGSSPTEEDKEALRLHVLACLPNAKIVSISAVSNEATDKCYEALKSSIDPATQRRWLFHGTSQEACANIVSKGFNRSYCGKNATVYGKGVYFAKNVVYSSSKIYSPPDPSGIQTIVAARVLVGKTMLGYSSMVEPPGDVSTTVDDTTNPTIFVVYKDFQAVPEFVVRLMLT